MSVSIKEWFCVIYIPITQDYNLITPYCMVPHCSWLIKNLISSSDTLGRLSVLLTFRNLRLVLHVLFPVFSLMVDGTSALDSLMLKSVSWSL